MGKRELLLVTGFVIVGAIVYQATAPPPRPGREGFSLSRIWRDIHSEIRSDLANGQATKSTSTQVGPDIRQFRARQYRGQISIVGEDREDVTVELEVSVSGAEQSQAEELARQFAVAVHPSSDALDLVVSVPEGLRRYRTAVSVRIPRRLAVEIEATTGPVEVREVAELRLSVLRSETTVGHIRGDVRGEQRDGALRISDVGGFRLVTRRTDLELERIAGESSLDISDGDLELRGIDGPLRIDGRRAEIELADTHAVQIVITDGEARIERPRGELKIETLRGDVSVTLAEPVGVEVTCTDAPIELVLPRSGGITLDALVTDGEIRFQSDDVSTIRERSAQRAQGAIGGGGPMVRLRASHANITIGH